MNVDSFKATAEQVVSQTAELTLSKVSTKARAGSRHASAAVARVQGKGSLGDCGGPRHWVGQGAMGCAVRHRKEAGGGLRPPSGWLRRGSAQGTCPPGLWGLPGNRGRQGRGCRTHMEGDRRRAGVCCGGPECSPVLCPYFLLPASGTLFSAPVPRLSNLNCAQYPAPCTLHPHLLPVSHAGCG